MRRPVLTAALTVVLLAAGAAKAAPLTPAREETTTASGGLARDSENPCRRAWRCGPYDCGWRQICAATRQPTWQRDHYFWRRHQWRRHYW